MKLIVGLGNPGKQYQKTRHNAGFMAVDFWLEKLGWGKFNLEKKFKAEISQGKINEKKIIMAKPQTFMNNSGEAVQLMTSFYKIIPQDIMVIYDELDLPFGAIRVRDSGSSAGHKGIESIMQKLGTDKFTRVRIGIRNEKADEIPADKFVLSKFSLWERIKMKKEVWPKVAEKIERILG